MDRILPKLNGKIKEIITVVDDGNVARFSKRLKNVSQQRLNRILNPDTRTGKYPGVPDDVLVSIATSMPNVNLDWLLADRGEMINKSIINSGINSGVLVSGDFNQINTCEEELKAAKLEVQYLKEKIKDKDEIIALLKSKNKCYEQEN